MRRFAAVSVVVCALAAVAYAQTPAPAADEAVLTWAASTEYATGGTLADPADVTYVIEALPPGGTTWGAVAIVKGATTYTVKGLWPGAWRFRVRAALRFGGFSAVSPETAKTVTLPILKGPATLQ